VAGAGIVGGLMVSRVRRFFRRRTDALILGGVLNVVMLASIGLTRNFWLALTLLTGWALIFAITGPMRQAFMNGLIPSEQRATVLSFDSLMGSAGGVVTQPALGRAADVYGYATSFVIASVIEALAIPFVFLARHEKAASDPIGEPQREPGIEIPPDGPQPDLPPQEYPQSEEPGYRAPGIEESPAEVPRE